MDTKSSTLFGGAEFLSLSFVLPHCGRSQDKWNQKALFTHAGHRDKCLDHLSALAGVPINLLNLKNALSGFKLVSVTAIVSWYNRLRWSVSYHNTHLMTCPAMTEIIHKCYQAPLRLMFFVWGLGTRLGQGAAKLVSSSGQFFSANSHETVITLKLVSF